MKAIRTTEKEWVLGITEPGRAYIGSAPDLWAVEPDDVLKSDLKRKAEVDTGRPCEWVEVSVISPDNFDLREALLLAGKVAIAARDMVEANMFNCSERIGELNQALSEYDIYVFKHLQK